MSLEEAISMSYDRDTFSKMPLKNVIHLCIVKHKCQYILIQKVALNLLSNVVKT